MERAGFTLKLNQFGEVVLVQGEETCNLGEKDAACEEMTRFLAEVDYGEQ